MAYLDEEKTLETTEEVEQVSEEVEEVVVEEESEKTVRSNKRSKKDNKKGGNAVKAAFSELKKVNWLGFKEMLKRTLVVLSVTAVFLVVIFGIDQLLSLLRDLLV